MRYFTEISNEKMIELTQIKEENFTRDNTYPVFSTEYHKTTEDTRFLKVQADQLGPQMKKLHDNGA